MKSLILNAHHLAPFVSEQQMQLLELRAQQHRRFSSIEFKVLEASDSKLVVRIVQEKSHAENYFPEKRLVEIVHETFDDVAGGRQVFARPFPYAPAPPEVVTAEWIQVQMTAKRIKVKDLSKALGVDANTISAYKNGVKPLSGVVRAMFYYYFFH